MAGRLEGGVKDRLATDTQEAIARLRERAGGDASGVSAELQKLESLMKKGKVDEAKVNEAIGIITAKLGEQKALHEVETKDLAQAVLGLETMLNELGFDFADLETFSAAEQALVDEAGKAVAEAENGLRSAEGSWVFKEARVKAANEKIEVAKTALESAQVKAKNRQRQRLMSANMESSLQIFQARVANTIEIMESRIEAINSELKSVSTAKVRAQKVRTESVAAYQKAKKLVESLKTRVERAETDLEDLTSGTNERAAAENQLSDLKKSLVEAEGQLSQELAVMQSKEKFAAELAIHETAQQKLLDNHKMWVRLLKSDSEERVVTFHSRLEAMKADADQMAAKKLSELGRAVDQANATMMARIGAASDDARMTQLETHPDVMRKMQKVREEQAAAHRAVDKRFGSFIEEFQKNYGINPLDASFVKENGKAA